MVISTTIAIYYHMRKLIMDNYDINKDMMMVILIVFLMMITIIVSLMVLIILVMISMIRKRTIMIITNKNIC